jgi:hypothetical protein
VSASVVAAAAVPGPSQTTIAAQATGETQDGHQAKAAVVVADTGPVAAVVPECTRKVVEGAVVGTLNFFLFLFRLPMLLLSPWARLEPEDRDSLRMAVILITESQVPLAELALSGR